MAEMLEKMKENILPVFLEELLMFKFFFLRKTKKILIFQNGVNLNYVELVSLKWKPCVLKDWAKKGALV